MNGSPQGVRSAPGTLIDDRSPVCARTRRPLAHLLVLAACVAYVSQAVAQPTCLDQPEHVAPGVEYFECRDTALVESQGPIAAYMLRLDSRRVVLRSVLSNDAVLDAERVDSMAARHDALAAVNAGFFIVRTGEPASVLKVGGELVSDSAVIRGAVAIRRTRRAQRFDFDQIAARVRLRVGPGRGATVIGVDGVDTTRERGRLMMYTPRYHEHSDTAAHGVEWVVSGRPASVRAVRHDAGRTPIPRDGFVLSYGGLELPAPLAGLRVGTKIRIETAWSSVHGTPADRFDQADDVVNGAGLLRRQGRTIDNWVAVEKVNGPSFVAARHPRTMVGVDREGFVWLVAVDGRQPSHSIGMTFADLLHLCDRLNLRDALNLDGGGSTTMVVRGRIVNHPSDVTGPRPVSDALIVTPRDGG